MKKYLANIGDEFFELENLEGSSIKERFLKVIFFIGLTILALIAVACVLCYFLFGLFLLDWLYYIVVGRTVLWNHLYD